jgi:pseudaminic acid synthase
MKTIEINGTPIGSDCPPYVIAEVSANHNGDIEQAKNTIKMAKESGASAVKIQSYTPDTMTLDVRNEDFLIKGGTWDGYYLYDLYQEAYTPYEWHQELFAYARDLGITLFSTPFDETAIDLLESLNTPAYKIASFEITDLPLLEQISRTGKPVIMSTGLANEEEIEQSIHTLRVHGCKDLVVLHCISGYPTPVEQANVQTVQLVSQRWPDVLVGLSDHTLSNDVSVCAVALGACVIEKHVTLNRSLGGPDSSFSLEPDELVVLVRSCKNTWAAIGKGHFQLKKAEESNLRFRRSIYISKDVQAGDVLTEENIRRVRPGYGLPPSVWYQVLGKRVKRDLCMGTALCWEDIDV